MPGPKPRLHLPFADWPEIDRRMWHAAVDTLTVPDALEKTPLERLTAERVRRFVEHLRATNTPHSVAIQMDSLYGAARTLMPNKDWIWLRNIKTRLYAAAPRGNTPRPVITSVQLVDLGMSLMEESEIRADKPISMANAIRYRDGLMIALLAQVPLRHKNFAAIEIGRDLIKECDDWFIVIPPEETKTKTYLDFQVPMSLRNQFSTYLTHVRPRMLRQRGCKSLWVSPKGGALSYSAVGPVVTRHTTERLGIRITPHDARDAAATTWAIAAPEHVGISRDLLAHTDLRTTTKYYNRAKGIEASRAHGHIISMLKRRPH